jgi:hypothetical protein
MTVRRIAWALAIAGALLFLALAAALLSGETRIRIPAIAGLVTFSMIILAHLGGIEWGLALRDGAGTERTRALALVLSILPAIAAWGIFWLPTPQWQVGAAAALFLAVWGADLWLARQGLLPAWFVDLRTAITLAVAVILAIAFFLL